MCLCLPANITGIICCWLGGSGHPSCHPTNSIKALKAKCKLYNKYILRPLQTAHTGSSVLQYRAACCAIFTAIYHNRTQCHNQCNHSLITGMLLAFLKKTWPMSVSDVHFERSGVDSYRYSNNNLHTLKPYTESQYFIFKIILPICIETKTTFSESHCCFFSCLISQCKHCTIPSKQWCLCIDKCVLQWLNVFFCTGWSRINGCIWIAWQVFLVFMSSVKPSYSLRCKLACFSHLQK